MSTALWGSPVALAGNAILILSIATSIYLWRANRVTPDVGFIVSLSWTTHLSVYYAVALWLRASGFVIGDPVVTQVLTLWSASIRLHILISTLSLAVYHQRRAAARGF